MPIIIIYDSACAFCSTFASWCISKNKHIRILPVQTKEARASLRSNGIFFVHLQTVYVIKGKQVYTQSNAICNVFAMLPYPWKALALACLLPRKITDYIYRLVAKHRYRISAVFLKQ